MDSILTIGQDMRLHPDIPRPGLLKGMLVVLAVSFIFLVSAISYPAIVFKGPLLDALPRGLGIGLVSAAVLGMGLALGSSYPGSVAHAHSAPTIMIGVVVLEFIKSLPAGVSPESMLPTVLGLISAATLLCGVVLYLVGRFRLANLIRYMPLPVVAGILAGSGWLLFVTAVATAIGKPVSSLWHDSPPSDLLKAGLTLTAAIGLWGLDRLRPRPTNLTMVLLTLLGGFWLVAFSLGQDRAALAANGWLFPPMSHADLWTPAGHWQAMQQADWLAIAKLLPLLLIVVLINAFGFLVNTTGIEQVTEMDLDLNHDARRVGAVNTLVGLLGGLPGYQNGSLSILVYRYGMPLRIIGLVAGACCVLVLLVGGNLLAYVPKVMASTMLGFLGMNLMQEWLRTKTRLMTALDFAVVLMVFLSVIFLGFIQALIFGAVAGIVLFVLRYSGIPAARNVLTGVDCQSTTQRSAEAQAHLGARGREILILRLHGFIFFGSASQLVSLTGRRLQQHNMPPLRHLILDMRLVSGVDVSALASFAKLERYALRGGFRLLISDVPPDLAPLLRSAFTTRPGQPGPQFFDHFDTALEWAENQLLLEERALPPMDAAMPFEEQARRIFGPRRLAQALPYFDTLTLDAGTVLSHQGEDSTDIYFVEQGQVAVLLAAGGPQAMRLSLMGPGTLIGEIAFYLGTRRTASIVAQTATRLRRLTREQLDLMQRDDPLLASALHRHMARALATKLVDSHRMVRALTQ